MHSRILSEANIHTAKDDITINSCSVFIDILLKDLALIETLPTDYAFDAVDGYETKSGFRLVGFNEKDAKQLVNYFKKSGDLEAECITPADDPDSDDEADAYYFIVSSEILFSNVLPSFKRAYDQIPKDSKQIANYKNQCVNDPLLPFYKLVNIADDIIFQAVQLEANCANEYTKGMLHVIFTLFIEAIKQARDHLIHGCAKGANYVEAASEFFKKFYDEHENLKNDEAASQLQMTVETFSQKIKQQNRFHLFSSPTNFSSSDEDELDQEQENSRGCSPM